MSKVFELRKMAGCFEYEISDKLLHGYLEKSNMDIELAYKSLSDDLRKYN